MPLNIEAIRDLPRTPVIHELGWRDSILYALGLGFGEDPTNGNELAFVYEDGLKPVPSICNVLSHRGFWAKEPEYGIDWVKLLHAEQAFDLHAPMPTAGRIRGETHIAGVEDKGAGKGALLHQMKELYDDATGAHLASVRTTLFLRGNGGEGAFGVAIPTPAALDARAPDKVAEIATRPGQALLYRLNGDYNPLHADPKIATRAGFERPILHGLCTNGIACRAILQAYCDFDPARLKSLFVRFSKPVLPGETLRFEFFEDGKALRFRTVAVERESIVLDRCMAMLA